MDDSHTHGASAEMVEGGGENGSFPSKVGEFSLQYSITLYYHVLGLY